MNTLTVDAVLHASSVGNPESAVSWGSVGLVYDDHHVAWGDIVPETDKATNMSWDNSHLDVWERALVGTSVDASSLLDVLDSVDPSLPGGAGVRRGLEQAFVTGLAQINRCQTVDVVAQALAIETSSTVGVMRLVIEADNRIATTELIHRMVALEPDGLGYRLAGGNVVESIGANAEYLQRFVRELAMILAGGDSDNPTSGAPLIYLGLNGAIGSLTLDPLRESGQILGHCAGLEQAAGNLPLWLEDPVLIGDEVLHVATLSQLRDFMRVRSMDSRIIGHTYTDTLDGLKMLIETDAVDGVRLLLEEWGGLRPLHDAIRLAQLSDKLVIINSRAVSPAWLRYLLTITSAVSADAVLVGIGEGSDTLASEARTALAHQRAYQHYIDNRTR